MTYTQYSLEDVKAMDRIPRGNLINSVTGVKPANLLVTNNQAGVANCAIFSSVVHLGSNPPLLSYIQRPLTAEVGHTYRNLQAGSKATLNHVTPSMLPAAHQTSAKYDEGANEAQVLGLPTEEITGWSVPVITEAPVQLLLELEDEHFITQNGCRMVILRITGVRLENSLVQEDGWVNLAQAGSMAVNGLDGYLDTSLNARYAYARVGVEPQCIDQ